MEIGEGASLAELVFRLFVILVLMGINEQLRQILKVLKSNKED